MEDNMTSILKVDTIQGANGSDIPYIKGHVVQVVPMIKPDSFTSGTSALTWYDVTGFTCSITPSSTSSKILIMSTINGSQNVGANRTTLRLLRDNSVTMLAPTNTGNRQIGTCGISSPHADLIGTSHITFLDDPATTSEVTYKWQGMITAGSGSFFINRSQNDTDNTGYARFASNITLMEIGG